ncbi:hypothetical protein [Fulvivirga sp.]|uniref:hypothetical protein n=2 Tax=Fulvivirga sp. TaxID=1931237 RepID=UPI0032EE00A4
MKIYISILLLAIAFSESWAQQSADIDKITSFHNFEFQSSPESLPGKLTLDLTISFGVKYYKYDDKDLKELYGNKIYDINLGYRDDLLEYVDFYFQRLNQADFDRMKDELVNQYGDFLIIEAVEQGVEEAIRWEGDVVTLDLYRYGNEAIDLHDRNKTVLAATRPVQ